EERRIGQGRPEETRKLLFASESWKGDWYVRDRGAPRRARARFHPALPSRRDAGLEGSPIRLRSSDGDGDDTCRPGSIAYRPEHVRQARPPGPPAREPCRAHFRASRPAVSRAPLSGIIRLPPALPAASSRREATARDRVG